MIGVPAPTIIPDCLYSTGATETPFGDPVLFPEGLHEFTGTNCCTWLSPNGDWGQVNAGLVIGTNASLLIDTLWDLPLTRRMLDAMQPFVASAPISTVVNTHGDGDHYWGNAALPEAEIISSAAAVETMKAEPSALIGFRRLGKIIYSLPLPDCRAIGGWFSRSMAPYDFRGLKLRRPTRTFDGSLVLNIGGREVRLREIEHGHSSGDVVIEVPDARLLYAGDIVFCGVVPLTWCGSPREMIAALDQLLALKIDVIVPGHGSPTDKSGVELNRRYWQYMEARIARCFGRGLSVWQAAERIILDDDFRKQPFAGWSSPEYHLVNISTAYRHLRGIAQRRSDIEWLLDMRRVALFANRLPGSAPTALRCR